VFGVAPEGAGVFGYAAHGKGVVGHSVSHTGVLGEVTGTTGRNFGVRGTTPSTSGIGVRGVASAASGDTYGALGVAYSPDGHGVYGFNGAKHGVGVLGWAQEGVGVSSGGNVAFLGHGNDIGIQVTGGMYGVLAESRAKSPSIGIVGMGKGYGIYGKSNGDGWAALFDGYTQVNGTLVASSKHFQIDHPLDPANRTLAHSCVESPEMLNVYSGIVTLGANGAATVRMPRYFRALNTSFRYQLTPLDGPAPDLHVAGRVSERGSFRIAGGSPDQEVSWQVTGVRQDAWARKHPLRVEQTKRRADRGRYLNPEVFGQSRSAAIHRLPKVKRPAKLVPPKLPVLRDG
jgi:hypothetical protein